MTSTVPSTEQINRPATGTTDERLDEVFAPIFDRAAQTAAADRGLWRVLAWVGAALTLAGLAGALRPGRAARRD